MSHDKESQEAGRDKGGFASRAFGGTVAAVLTLRLQISISRTLREQRSVVPSHAICGYFLCKSEKHTISHHLSVKSKFQVLSQAFNLTQRLFVASRPFLNISLSCSVPPLIFIPPKTLKFGTSSSTY